MLRWFYMGLGCLFVAGFLYSESLRRTGREPAALVGSFEAPDLSFPSLRLPGSGAPVLVFQVHEAASVAAVRAAVAPSRIVADIPDGFALAEGRIVAVGPDATGALLMAAGWEDRPLEIFQPAPRLPKLEKRRKAGLNPNALAHKSHLSRHEAMAVMERLD